MVFIHRYKGYYLCNYDFGFALRQNGDNISMRRFCGGLFFLFTATFLSSVIIGLCLEASVFFSWLTGSMNAKKHLPQKSFFLMKIDPSGRLFYFDYKNYAARFDFISR